MLAGAEQHFCRASQCLRRKSRRDHTRQSHFDAAIAQCFDYLKHIGRSTAAQTSHRIQKWLTDHFDKPHRRQQFAD